MPSDESLVWKGLLDEIFPNPPAWSSCAPSLLAVEALKPIRGGVSYLSGVLPLFAEL